MISPDPLVSILINNYNYGRFLHEAISSALAQTYTNIEVIVVDDGSTDNSRDVIATFGDKIIPVLKENEGQGTAYNAGFAVSRGDICCFLDSDDMFAPQKAATLVQIYRDNPSIGWCFECMTLFDDRTKDRYPTSPTFNAGIWDARDLIRTGKTPFIESATSGMSYRRSLLGRLLPMPNALRVTSDGYLKLLALAFTEGMMAKPGLTLQRIHGSNAYTGLSAGKMQLVGKLGLQTGFSIQERFPELHRLSVVLFSRGLGMCWVSRALTRECREVTRHFFATLPFLGVVEVLLRATYWSAREILFR